MGREGLSDRVTVDSAGVGGWHIGSAPDRRAQATARGRGIDLSKQRARQAKSHDHFSQKELIKPEDGHILYLLKM